MYVRNLGAEEIESGRRVLHAMKESGMRVTAALWAYSSETGIWRLVIATHEVDRKGPIASYIRLSKLLLEERPATDLSDIDISLVSPRDSYIREIRSRYHKAASESPIQVNSSLGQETFVYTA